MIEEAALIGELFFRIGRMAKSGLDVDAQLLKLVCRSGGACCAYGHSPVWHQLEPELSTSQIAELLCGLAYYDVEFNWAQGSPTCLKPIVNMLAAREPGMDFLDDVTGWVCKITAGRCSHPFREIPSFYPPENYSQYLRLSREREFDAQIRLEQLRKTQEQKKHRIAVLSRPPTTSFALNRCSWITGYRV